MSLGACLSPILPSPLITIMMVFEMTKHFTTYQKVKDATHWQGYSRMHVFVLLTVICTISYATYHAIEPEVYLSPVPNSFVTHYSNEIHDQYDWAVGVLIGIGTSSDSFYFVFSFFRSFFLFVCLFFFLSIPSLPMTTLLLLSGGGILALAYVLIGVVVTLFFKVLETIFDKIHRRFRLFMNCFIAGVLYGLFMYLFPLIFGSGTLVIDSLVVLGPELGAGLLVSSLFMKMVSFWVCAKGGLAGGAIFPLIVIGLMCVLLQLCESFCHLFIFF
jgi:hypothetical protein